MDRKGKAENIDLVRDRFGRMAVAVLSDYRGMKVKEANDLRDACRGAAVELRVVKNTILRVAARDTPYETAIRPHIAGMTAVAWSYEDPAVAARVLTEYARKNPKVQVKCALLDGRVLDAQGVKALASMPGKNALRANLLATFMAPATRFAGTLLAAARGFVCVTDAMRRSLEEGGK